MDFTRTLKICFLTGTLILAMGTANPAYCLENLHFSPNIKKSLTPALSQFLKQKNEKTLTAFELAGSDLNRDGIDEWIIRPRNCNQGKNICKYYILADRQAKLVLLSEIAARTLMLADTYTHGIRNIQAYSDFDNDYAYKMYIWNPSEKRYALAGQEPVND